MLDFFCLSVSLSLSLSLSFFLFCSLSFFFFLFLLFFHGCFFFSSNSSSSSCSSFVIACGRADFASMAAYSVIFAPDVLPLVLDHMKVAWMSLDLVPICWPFLVYCSDLRTLLSLSLSLSLSVYLSLPPTIRPRT